jgi:hypothetical protein
MEHHDDALKAGLERGLLFEVRAPPFHASCHHDRMLIVAALSCRASWPLQLLMLLKKSAHDAEVARAGTYALAVMCGHTHERVSPHVA